MRRTWISKDPEYHVASYKPDRQTMMFTIRRNGDEGCELNPKKTANISNLTDRRRGTSIGKHVVNYIHAAKARAWKMQVCCKSWSPQARQSNNDLHHLGIRNCWQHESVRLEYKASIQASDRQRAGLVLDGNQKTHKTQTKHKTRKRRACHQNHKSKAIGQDLWQRSYGDGGFLPQTRTNHPTTKRFP